MSLLARAYLAVLGIVGLITGAYLLSAADQTAALFVWPVSPPATALFMGAGYLGTGLTLLGALSLAPSWGQVRLLIGPLVAFATLMLVATALHADRFFWDRPQTWLWVCVYGVMLVGAVWLAISHRGADRDGFRASRLRGSERLALGLTGLSMAVASATLFLAPDLGAPLWPWPLTPLTSRVVAGWIAVGGTLGLSSSLMGDALSVRIPLIGWTLTVLLFQLAALTGLPPEGLNEPSARLYLLALGGSVLGALRLLYRLQERRAPGGV